MRSGLAGHGPRFALSVAAALSVGGALACSSAGAPTSPAPRAAAPPASWHGFGVDHWPNASWRPYAPGSPFNQRIPAGTRPVAGSQDLIDTALSLGTPGHLTAGVAQSSDDWGHPTYYASTTDPVFTLRTTANYGSNAINGARIRVPDAALAAGGGDGHMTIVQPSGWEYDLWQVHDKPRGGGTLTFSWGGRLRIDGDGLRTGGTASRFGNLAGMIRAPELAAGRIDHALFIVLRCTGTGTSFGYGARQRESSESSYVYPAVSGGSRCPSGVNAPPMGARLRLAMSGAQIDALRLPVWKRAIVRALARYGGYIGDTGGDGIGLMFESSTMYTSFGRPDPLVRVAESAGLASYGGRYVFDVSSDVEWQRYLRVIPPPKR
ncbi:MAG: hypothetical protein JWP17_3384 [Solirubrobacterales bacterium]|jgi:hypothetical protein|nr:hypothetical protein [Solirubrobacterales bacterium]